jgi:hypothetical protein
MNYIKRKGFVLIVVIMTLSLMGAMLVVLGNASRNLLFETNAAYLDACTRNLSASGLAWAKYNIKNRDKNLLSGRIPLDVNDMKMPTATLTLDAEMRLEDKADITVHTFASRGRQHMRKETTYLIYSNKKAAVGVEPTK